MKKILLQKIELPFFEITDFETKWLIKNIGSTDTIIRDDIVFIILARGITEGLFTQEQFAYLKHTSISENLLFFNIDNPLPDTLTRSFSALLNGFIIEADGKECSPYHQNLTSSERSYFFNAAIQYLYKEKDKTGYSQDYGWVHAFGHIGDYLYRAIQHNLFDRQQFGEMLDAFYYVFKNLDAPFEVGEERRLAHVIVEALQNNRVSQEFISNWIDSLDFPLESVEDYHRLSSFESFLSYIYFKSNTQLILDSTLKDSILNYLNNYTLY